MAHKYKTLTEAMTAKKLTQQQLADLVTQMRRKRSSGKRLTLSQNFVSQLESGERRAGPDLAQVIAEALDNEIDPAVLVFGPKREAA